MTAEELEPTLKALPLRSMSVNVEGRPGHLVAIVSSPDFEPQDEAARQQMVWRHLIEKVSDEERAQVEFVFTLTPDELREIKEAG
jgi:acid stress-induced BolA-like protein IbaG/YrbA